MPPLQPEAISPTYPNWCKDLGSSDWQATERCLSYYFNAYDNETLSPQEILTELVHLGKEIDEKRLTFANVEEDQKVFWVLTILDGLFSALNEHSLLKQAGREHFILFVKQLADMINSDPAWGAIRDAIEPAASKIAYPPNIIPLTSIRPSVSPNLAAMLYQNRGYFAPGFTQKDDWRWIMDLILAYNNLTKPFPKFDYQAANAWLETTITNLLHSNTQTTNSKVVLEER